MERTFIVMPITTCGLCGTTGADQSAVMGVKGTFCRSCTTMAYYMGERHRSQTMGAMLAAGNVTLPLPDLEMPAPPEPRPWGARWNIHSGEGGA